mgnify:FL=1
MENENKEKVILTDEELKEVTGGKQVLNKQTLLQLSSQCEKFGGMKVCIQLTDGLCAWINNQCIPNPKKFEY